MLAFKRKVFLFSAFHCRAALVLRAPPYFPFDRRICQVTEEEESSLGRMLNADYGVAAVEKGKKWSPERRAAAAPAQPRGKEGERGEEDMGWNE